MSVRPSPSQMWLEGAITGRRPIEGAARDTLSSALLRLFADANETERDALAASIIGWVSAVHQDRGTWQRVLGIAGLASDLVQVWTAARLLMLEPVAAFAAENLLRERALGWDLAVGARRGMSHDAEAAVYHLLAASPVHAPRFRHLWFRLCARAGDEWPEHYVEIGLLGLRQAGSSEASLSDQAQDNPANVPPPWLAGLVAWLPRATSREAFVLRWHAFRASTPRGPAIWRQWLQNLEPAVALAPNDCREWLGIARESSTLRPSQGGNLHSPYPQETEDALRGMESLSPPVVQQKLEALFRRHEAYVAATGETNYFVRASSRAAQRLLTLRERWAAVEALRRIKAALEHEPGNAVLWNLLGRALAAAGRSDAAVWTFSDAVRRFPERPENRVELARLLWARDSLDEAEGILRTCADLHPDDPPSHVELARLLWARGNVDEAEGILRTCADRHPDNEPSHVQLARLLWARGNVDEARRVLDRAPSDQMVLDFRARLHQDLGLPASPPQAPAMGPADGAPGDNGVPAWLDVATAQAKLADLALTGPMAQLALAAKQQLISLRETAGGHPAVAFYIRRHGLAEVATATTNISELLEAAANDPANSATLQCAFEAVAGHVSGRVSRLVGDLVKNCVTVQQLESLADQLNDNRQSQSLAPAELAAAAWAATLLASDDPLAAVPTALPRLLRSLAEILLPGSDAALAPALAA